MQLCVENGVFTVSFLKESAAKVEFPHLFYVRRIDRFAIVPRVDR